MIAFTGRDDCVTATCRTCGEEHSMMACITDYADWQFGKYIQDAMPYLSAGERELLISGTCGPCFDKMFGDSEE